MINKSIAAEITEPNNEEQHTLNAISPLEKKLHSINLDALSNFGFVAEYLNLKGFYRDNWFVGTTKFLEGKFQICIGGYGEWEYGNGKSTIAFGDDLVSLATFILKLPRLCCASRLIKLLAAISSRTGLDEVPGLSLCPNLGGVQVVPVPINAPQLPEIYDESYEVKSETGQLLGYMHTMIDFSNNKKYSPIGKYITTPITCWKLSDGTYCWKNQPLPKEHGIYGLDRLSLNKAAPVIITDDAWSATLINGYILDGEKASISLGLLSSNNSIEDIDFSPLYNRSIYIACLKEGVSEIIARKIITRSPYTKIFLAKINFLTNDNPQKQEIINYILQNSTEWLLPDYIHGAQDNRLNWNFTLITVKTKVSSYNFGKFRVSDKGIEMTIIKNGEPTLKRIASRIDVVAYARNSQNIDWGACLRFRDQEGISHDWCIPRSKLGGDTSFCKELLAMGAYISPYQEDRLALAECLLTMPVTNKARSVSKVGWDNNLFVFADGSHIGNSKEMVSYQTGEPSQCLYTQNGSLNDWWCNIGMPCKGNSRLILGISAALCGPVLPLLGEESGGFHFTGESSTGKTTALHTACSVWGRPNNHINSWRSTTNGLEGRAALHNHTLLAADEMGQITPQEAGQAVYMLANGQGKIRAQRDGTTRPPTSWQLMFLSTGEVGLEQHMSKAGLEVMAGQQARLIDLHADAGAGYGLFENLHGKRSGAEFSHFLKEQSSRYHGTLGRAWVKTLANIETREQILDDIRAGIVNFSRKYVPENADGQVIRVARRFGLVASVAECCVSNNLLHWDHGEATDAAATCFRQWVECRGGVRNLEADIPLIKLRKIITERGESGFTEIGLSGLSTSELAQPSRVTLKRLGFRKQNQDGHTDYYFLPDAFKEEVCAGPNLREAIKNLVRSGALVLGPDGKPQVTKRLPGLGAQRVYHVRSTILSGPPTCPTKVVT